MKLKFKVTTTEKARIEGKKSLIEDVTMDRGVGPRKTKRKTEREEKAKKRKRERKNEKREKNKK